MINGSPAATTQTRTLHSRYAEVGDMRDSVAGAHAGTFSVIPFNHLTKETGQQELTLLLELSADAGSSQVLAAAKPPFADPTRRIEEGKLMVTAQFMRPVKEIIS